MELTSLIERNPAKSLLAGVRWVCRRNVLRIRTRHPSVSNAQPTSLFPQLSPCLDPVAVATILDARYLGCNRGSDRMHISRAPVRPLI